MKKILISLALTVCFLPHISFASPTDGTIDANQQYAWSNNYGWLNFKADQGNIHVTDSGLSGYIWNTHIGWINLAPTDSGQQVINDGEGHLSGSAWGQGIGWVNFSGITIDANGLFRGSLTGADIETITFDCEQCAVKTDWRPMSVRGGGTNAGAPAGGVVIIPPPPIKPIQPPIQTTSPIVSPENSTLGSAVSKFTSFEKNLHRGNKNPDVLQLQRFLNTLGFLVAPKGFGSPGKETDYFGPLTYQAVKALQEKYAAAILWPLNLKKGTGNFYEFTRAFVNKVIESSQE